MGIFDEVNKQVDNYIKQYSDQWKDITDLRDELQKQIELYEKRKNGEQCESEYDPEHAQLITMKLMLKIVGHLNPGDFLKKFQNP